MICRTLIEHVFHFIAGFFTIFSILGLCFLLIVMVLEAFYYDEIHSGKMKGMSEYFEDFLKRIKNENKRKD